jgi:hypothetical protein
LAEQGDEQPQERWLLLRQSPSVRQHLFPMVNSKKTATGSDL